MAGGSPVDLAPSRDYGNEPRMVSFVQKIKTFPPRNEAPLNRAPLRSRLQGGAWRNRRQGSAMNAQNGALDPSFATPALPYALFSQKLVLICLDKADVVIEGMIVPRDRV